MGEGMERNTGLITVTLLRASARIRGDILGGGGGSVW